MTNRSPVNWALWIAVTGVLGCFVAGTFFPLHWWGVNFQAYLPLWVPFAALVLGIAIAYWAKGLPKAKTDLRKVPSWAWSLLTATTMAILFYTLGIRTQMYGDTRAILQAFEPGGELHGKYDLLGAFSPNVFGSKNGEQFTYSLITGIQGLLGCSIFQAFRILTCVLGFGFTFVWMEFVQYKVSLPLARILGIALGLTAGITQVYYGHPEVYAAPVLIFTSFLIAMVLGLEQGSRKWLVGSGLLLLLAIRSHSAGFALAPAYLYACVASWAGSNPSRQIWLGWRRLGWIIPTIFLALGILGYLVVFDSGDEILQSDGRGKNVFLTPLGNDSIDNAYYIFGAWHLWDFVQEYLLSAAMAITLLLALATGALGPERWNKPSEIASIIAFIVLSFLYFAIDPVLSMPRDWDLCGLVAPPLLVIAVLWLSRGEDTLARQWLPLGLVLGIGGLQLCAIPVNHSLRLVHLRLVDVATHVFISDHGGSGFFLQHSVYVEAFDQQERAELLESALKRLRPNEGKHNRGEVAFIEQSLGNIYMGIGQGQKAIDHFKASQDRAPLEFQFYAEKAQLEYDNRQFESAHDDIYVARQLYPKNASVFLLAYKIVRDKGHAEAEAIQYGVDYLQLAPKDSSIILELDSLRAVLASDSLVQDTL